MPDTSELKLSAAVMEKLQAYAELLGKDPNTILREALENYFLEADKRILEKSMQEKDPDTDISFDEFWDDVEF